ncbi:MMPL family transporter [Nocardioides sp. TF02-7]|uniref:MMPL family transporter n=1 Tax=Nocardioides sp. TF02-7 TaxID=2917724 RepID=UPI001F0671B6|nr:MMPL family transporter [Nocardioides sp. TF02-7]UMG94075.1 MMPL family transporter [Nocardioides sp. TF02-7]
MVAAPEGQTLDEREYRGAVDELIAGITDLPQVDGDAATSADSSFLKNPVDAAAAQEEQIVGAARQQGGDVEAARQNAAALSPLSEDGRVGVLTFEWDVEEPTDIEPSSQEALADLLGDVTEETGLVAEANGPGMTSVEPPGATAELIGIGVALLVLLLTFGSLVAAGLPIVNAVVGVGLGLAGVTAATALTDSIGSTTPILASMLGLAVGIDYTLFIVARYRSELHHTDDRAHAAGIAVGTSGSAVVFAGLTVLIALAALTVVGIPFLTAMGLAAAATVLLAVLVALTLLPAVLGMLKSKAFGGRVRRYRPVRDEHGLVVNNGVRWARLLGRAPLAFAVLVVIVLGALAVPMAQMQLAFPSDSTASVDTTQRRASDLMAEAFGPGREGPLLVVVDGRDVEDDDERQAAFGEVAGWAAGQDDVANAQVVATNAPVDDTGAPTGAATGAIIQLLPESGPTDEATLDLLENLRDGEGGVEESTGTDLGVTGLTAITTDVSDRLNGALPVYLAVVIGLAFVLLVLVFRSILVPLTATLGFLPVGAGHPRRDRRGVPGGRVRHLRGPADRQLPPDHADRHRVRLGDGLPGVPGDPDAGGARARPLHPGGGRRRVPQQRPRRDGRGNHHDRGVRGVHADGRPDHQVDGLRARDLDRVRRVHRPHGADPRGPLPARREGLVAPRLARPPAAQRRRRGRVARARLHPHRPPARATRSSPPPPCDVESGLVAR